MSTIFLRPGHLHTPSRVLSCSSEQGLTIAPPVAATANVGTLRPRTSGVPLAVTSAVVRLQGGGGPFGYGNAGASAAWRFSTDTTSQYRGYIDTPHLMRVESPVTTTSIAHTSTPRELSDGSLGFLTATTTGTVAFHRVSTAGVTTTVSAGLAAAAAGYRPDLVRMPSGRLVAVIRNLTTMHTRYSDDDGTTWSVLGSQSLVSGGTWDVVCAEYAGDLVTLLLGDAAGVNNAGVFVSRDGGVTWATVNSGSAVLENPRTCVLDDVIHIVSGPGIAPLYPITAYRLIPGGDLGTAIDTGSGGTVAPVVAARDDGVIWLWAWGTIEADCAYSTDGGATWTVDTDSVIDTNVYPAGAGYTAFSAGIWRGASIVLAVSDSSAGTTGKVHAMTFGEWSTVSSGGMTDHLSHVYVPIDTPDVFNWTKVNFGAGATITNDGPLKIVSTGADNSQYTSPATFWNPAATDTREARFRVRVNSGGSVADNRSRIQFAITDGVNEQTVNLRFSATAVQGFDGAGNSLGSAAITAGVWYDFRFGLRHDSPAGAGKASLFYRADTDAFGKWTTVFDDAVVVEIVGLTNNVKVGGVTGGATNWDVMFLGAADYDNDIVGQDNPGETQGRRLSAAYDYFLVNGIHLGARNTGGILGDTYTVATTYGYGKENLWREIRPSKQVRSAADSTAWNVVFDASALDKFKGDTVAIFGTNIRTATLQMNATDAWGAPSVSVSLDATVFTGTIDAAIRGPGYVGTSGAPNWRPHQWRSDGDAHRWFVLVGEEAYEITDNDESRLYVEGIDLSAASGTLRIFGDRMAATFAFSQYRFMRLSVASQPTADNEYRVGTPIIDKRFTPLQSYDFGFVRRVEPTVEVFETESGYRSHARLGPRRHVMQIQWPPVDQLGPSSDLEARIRDFYAALEGGPFALWTNTADQQTLRLYQISGAYQATNLLGEHTNEVTRIDQLVLEEVW